MKTDTLLRRTNTVVIYGLLGFLTFLTLFPLFWMLNNSLKTNTQIFQNIFALPTALHFENYTQAWNIGRLGPQFINTLIYTFSSTLLILALSTMMGFAFGKMAFGRSTRVLYGLLGLGILVSLQAILIPLFIMVRSLGMQDSHWGIILVYTALGLPIPVFLTTEFIKGVPGSLLESARIDGAGNGRILWHIVVPLLAPVLTTVAILNVLGVWNEFMLVLVLGNDKTNSISVGVYSFSSATSQRYDRQLAALVIAVFPVICAYLAFNKLITQGVVAGAVKG